jgi:Kef-type K+ transport system membrane component KefB
LDTFCHNVEKEGRLKRAIVMNSAVLGQALFTAMVSPIFMRWVNNENPEGKPMKGSHLVLSIAFMVMSCASSILYNYSPILSAFITGICFPREGRVSKWVISKINYLLTTIFFPIFFLWMGYAADFRQFQPQQLGTWGRLFIPVLIVMGGKVVGTVVCGAILGFHWPESVAIGLLLATKGHFHIYMAIKVASIFLISLFTIFVLIQISSFITCKHRHFRLKTSLISNMCWCPVRLYGYDITHLVTFIYFISSNYHR